MSSPIGDMTPGATGGGVLEARAVSNPIGDVTPCVLPLAGPRD